MTDRNPAEGLVLAEGIVFCRLGSGLAHVNISLSGPIPSWVPHWLLMSSIGNSFTNSLWHTLSS